MAKPVVECLCCGERRRVELREPGECRRCGYVGWARSHDLSEDARRALRDRPVTARMLRAV